MLHFLFMFHCFFAGKKIEDGVIINEYLKGYKYKQKIIRHAQVVVAKNKK